MPHIRHVVRQGDTIPSISAYYGFRDWATVWNAPENERLRKRRDPNLLLPKDVVYIPERRRREESGATDHHYRFRCRRRRVRLIARVLDPHGAPYASVDFKLSVGSRQLEGVTDTGGWIDVEISSTDDQAFLEIEGEHLLLRIGELDPAEESSGYMARLANMGYLQKEERDPINLAAGVEDFQSDFGLKVDAVVGPQTIAEIVKQYGS